MFEGDVFMTHDIDDLLEIIKRLEERIIKLEKNLQGQLTGDGSDPDGWYWEHG